MRYLSMLIAWSVLGLPVLAAEPESSWDAKADLAALQGNWKLQSAIAGPVTIFGQTPEFILLLAKQDALVRIDGRKLTPEGSELSAQLDNAPGLPEKQQAAEKAVLGTRLILLTLGDGQELLASYNLGTDGFTLRYPAGCCSRSGNVLNFARQK